MTDYPESVYDEARRTHQYISDGYQLGLEAFAEFAHVFCGLAERDAYAAFYKEQLWCFREGHWYPIRLGCDPRYSPPRPYSVTYPKQ